MPPVSQTDSAAQRLQLVYKSTKLTRTSTALGNILSTDTHCHKENWWWWRLLFIIFVFFILCVNACVFFSTKLILVARSFVLCYGLIPINDDDGSGSGCNKRMQRKRRRRIGLRKQYTRHRANNSNLIINSPRVILCDSILPCFALLCNVPWKLCNGYYCLRTRQQKKKTQRKIRRKVTGYINDSLLTASTL